jgi:glycerol-3-phosphate cytidylyltransferase-like family protein
MKNIHVLPTDKPSRLTKINDELFFGKNEREMLSEPSLNIAAQHLYIISDEEIKEGDWGLSKLNEVILFGRSYNEKFYKKIILTTDPDLIVMGNITPLDDDFLNWFVKNPTVEYVTVERLEDGQFVDYLSTGKAVEGVYENYKVIIPEEEPKQETLNKINNMNEEIKKQINLLQEEQTRVKQFINENNFNCTTAPYVIAKQYRDEIKKHIKILKMNLEN